MPRAIRRPTHSGSWYSDDPIQLAEEIERWMADATAEEGQHARAILGPHAGYAYCGHVMAYAYKQIDPTRVKRVFVIGPSHHAYLSGCALSSATHYSTPLGNMPIDVEMVAELRASGDFESMSMAVDEAEHSMELHLPFIFHTLRGHDVRLVPILVGSLSNAREEYYGALLGRHLDDPGALFVISSDFCHWGSRFNYTFYDKSKGPIYESIEWLDRQGMDLIQQADADGFSAYLHQYSNTICGRHPIGIFLQMLKHSSIEHRISFRHYDQSSQCNSIRDSSVSYAAAIIEALPLIQPLLSADLNPVVS